MVMKETVIVLCMDPKFEYFCWNCGELRLSFKDRWTCGDCGSIDIKKGSPGSLNRAKLVAQRIRRLKCVHRHSPEP